MELDKYVEEVDDLLDEVLPILEHYRQDNRSNGLLWIQVGDLIRRLDVLYRTVPTNDLEEQVEKLEDKVKDLKEAISDIQDIIDGI